jgi:putative nucleotidyltransferase with HDIG domain
MIFAGTLAAYTVRDIQNRTQMFQSIFYIFIGLSLPIMVFGLEHSTDSVQILKKIGMSGINSVLSPLITFGLLFILERVTNIATDLRIKEFDDLNHPLLVKMSEIAPGTYQHTLGVAMLSERCAREIEANSLLVKVGSYFHDIGKMEKPEYFTENQIGIENKHDLLSPKKSAKIIIDHVQDGIELAKQYKLPQRITDFIPMHQGTTLVKHFYAKQLEIANGKEVNLEDFRYPGPNPNSKEAAIVMVCDFAEAISRLDSRSLEDIENIIDENINKRIADGQFDDCNITIEELKRIKSVIAKTLVGMTHKRINYKEIPKGKEGLT